MVPPPPPRQHWPRPPLEGRSPGPRPWVEGSKGLGFKDKGYKGRKGYKGLGWPKGSKWGLGFRHSGFRVWGLEIGFRGLGFGASRSKV